jgi:hypothetical protein
LRVEGEEAQRVLDCAVVPDGEVVQRVEDAVVDPVSVVRAQP